MEARLNRNDLMDAGKWHGTLTLFENILVTPSPTACF
jgi:hypothetical protein